MDQKVLSWGGSAAGFRMLSPGEKTRTAARLLACTAFLTFQPCMPTASWAQSLVIQYESQPGDSVGQGVSLMVTEADGQLGLYGGRQGLHFSFYGPQTGIYLEFSPAPGRTLAPGVYEGAERWAFRGPRPGLDVSIDGAGCNTLSGRFVVHEATFAGNGSPLTFAADFEQHCDREDPALFGSIRYNSAVPLARSISIESPVLDEGDIEKTRTVAVSLSRPSATAVSVTYSSMDESAVQGVDYRAVSGVLTFPPGVTSAAIEVPVMGNTAVQSSRVFHLGLTNPLGAALAFGDARVTIEDDEKPRTWMYNTAAVKPNSKWTGYDEFVATPRNSLFYMGSRYGVGVEFNYDLGHDTGYVYFAGAGNARLTPGTYVVTGDGGGPTLSIYGLPYCYVAQGRFVVFAADYTGEVLTRFAADYEAECADRRMRGSVRYNYSPSSSATASVSIADDALVEHAEPRGGAFVGVALSAPLAAPAQVSYTTTDGTAYATTEYEARSGSLVFETGWTQARIRVPVIDDATAESDRQFQVTLSAPSNLSVARSHGIVTIVDDDSAPIVRTLPATFLGSSGATFQGVVELRSPLLRAEAWFEWGPTNSYGRSTYIPNGNVVATGDLSVPYRNDAWSMTCNTVYHFRAVAAINGMTAYGDDVTMRTAPCPATLILPTYGSVLSSPSQTFTWTAGSGIDIYRLWVGTTPGGQDIYSSPYTSATTITVTGLPVRDGWAYIALRSHTAGAPLDSGWIENRYAFRFTRPLVCPTLVTPGSSFSLQVAGGWSPTDWVGLYEHYGPPNRIVTWGYVSMPRPQTVTLVAPMSAGYYDLRLWPNNTTANLIAECSLTVLPLPTVSVHNATVVEGNSGSTSAVFSLNLSPTATMPISVFVTTSSGTATAGSDFQSLSTTVTFNPGEYSKTVSVPIVPDLTPEGNETFFLSAVSVTPGAVIGDSQGLGTITNDDAWLACPASAPARSSISIQVLSGASANDWIGVFPAGAPNTAYSSWSYIPLPRPQTGTLTAPSNTGYFTVRLFANNSASVLGACNIEITAAVPTLAISDATVIEGNGANATAMLSVTLTPAATGPVTVQYATAAGTAVPGADFLPISGTLVFNQGETSRLLMLSVIGETRAEPSEVFQVELSNVTGPAIIGDAQARVTILNDDDAVLCPASALPGDPIAVQILGGASATDWLALYPENADDHAYLTWAYVPLPRPRSVFWTAPSMEGNYHVRLWSNNGFATRLGECAIRVSAMPALAIEDASLVEGNAGSTNAIFTVRLTPAAASSVSVAFATLDGTATAGGDFGGTSGSLVFAPGETLKTISVAINGDDTPESNESFVVGLSDAVGAVLVDGQAHGLINNDDSLLVCPASAPAGGVIPVRAFGGSSGTDWLAVYTSASPIHVYSAWTYVPLPRPQVITLPAPFTTGAHVIRLWADNRGDNLIGQCDIAITSTPILSIDDVTVVEGNGGATNANFAVRLSRPSAGAVSVAYATGDGTAASGSDFGVTSGTLTFAPGQSIMTLSVPVFGDTIAEGSETFSVNLSNVAGDAVIGDAQGQATIATDDALLTCPASVPAGSAVSLQIFGGSSALDWVGLYQDAAASTNYLRWSYVPIPRPQVISLAAPSAPGSYDIRLWANNGYTLLGACDVSVTASVGGNVVGGQDRQLRFEF